MSRQSLFDRPWHPGAAPPLQPRPRLLESSNHPSAPSPANPCLLSNIRETAGITTKTSIFGAFELPCPSI